MQLEAPTYKWKSASFSSASQFSAKNLTKGNHFCVCLKCYSPCCTIYSHCCIRLIDDKPHPREVKNNVFTVLLPLPRNCTPIITEKHIKSLNMTTGSQIEGKKNNSFLCPHTLFCFRGMNAYSCWLGREKKCMGRKQKLWDEPSNSFFPLQLLKWCKAATGSPAGPCSLLHNLWGWCLQIHTSGHHPPGNRGANLQWARGKSQGKEKSEKEIDDEWKEHHDIKSKG